jgi:hypothetical protein
MYQLRRVLASGNGQGHSGILLYSFQHITYRLVLGIKPRRLFFPGLISGRTACLVGLETSLLSLLLFFCFFLFPDDQCVPSGQ